MKKYLILPLSLVFFASVANAQWAEPTLTPPSGNVLAPLRLDSNGRLGIGTASPAYPLDVVGNIRSTGSILSSTFGTNTGDLNITGSGWGMIFNIDTDANSTNNYIFRGDNVEIMRLTDTGRLGIGVANPATPLQVSGIISSITGNFTNSELNDYLLLDPVDDSFRFFSNNIQRFTVLASGNVGIGNAAPAYALDVAGDINATGCVRVDGTCLTSGGGGTIDGTGTANTLAMFTAATTLGNSNISELADSSVRVTTSGGYADFGPKNASWNHIYTDRPASIINTPLYVGTGANNSIFSAYGTNNLRLQTNGTDRVTVLATNGNVGIGTAAPAQLLHVAGTAQANRLNILGTGYGLINTNVTSDNTAGLSLHYPGLTAWQLGRRGSSLSFATTGGASSDTMGTDRLTITSTGNVGIGTTAPASRLQVNTPTIGGGELRVVASDTEAGLGLYTSGHSWVAGVGAWGNNDDFTIANNTAGTEGVKFLIQPNGNVGVGITNPAYALDVNGEVAATSFRLKGSTPGPVIENAGSWLIVRNSAGGAGYATFGGGGPGLSNDTGIFASGLDRAIWAQAQSVGAPSTSYGVFAQNFAAGVDNWGLYCSASGSGRCGGNRAWTNTSDLRLKKNISTITDGLDKVLKLRGVNYQWKDATDDKNNVGFIAQEVKEVLPEVVSQGSDGYYSINESSMSAVLVEAIKELKAENDDLKARIEKLEEKIK